MSSNAVAEWSQRERVEHLRQRIAAIPGRPYEGREGGAEECVDVLPVPAPLKSVLPSGGVVKGTVCSVAGSSYIVLGIIAEVTQSGGYVAIVGLPNLGLAAAVDMGANLRRVAVIPDPGSDPVDVAAVLLDGMDLVVLSLHDTQVQPSRARAVTARVRNKKSVLLVVGGSWPVVHMRIEGNVRAHEGLERGHGRIRGMSLSVRASSRSGRQRSATVKLSCQGARAQPDGVVRGGGRNGAAVQWGLHPATQLQQVSG
ncbi:hypothetical protein IEU95_04805 [Hoyosella rhizosphaerae]|uniref:Uncharacterized protein n=1 Tax=Hoyosella rhizosphaerae TaxID=1755582 RepID=A0A916U9X2_9ACTN|nr:hypothetical protein [Hoyosella rhizosphaerae]MBN4926137.1 hypothetical protein [Hoyosella rhizosphaerae]GGC65247.1 hypothetical protein GCM10011410_17170 [Hoyosella rhizosphaerae]